MADSDGTLQIDADVPSFLKDIEEMASKTEGRFSAMGKKLTNVFAGMFGVSGASAAGGNWQQTPMARTTKELQEQAKIQREMLKIERDKRDIQRAGRFAAARAVYGEHAELTETGELRKSRADMARAQRREHVFRRMLHTSSGLIGAASSFASSGGSDQGVTQLAGSIAGMLAPEFGPLINSITSAVTSGFDKRDAYREAALTRFKATGKPGIDIDEGEMLGRSFDDVRKGFGFTMGEFSNMYAQAAKQDALGATPQMTMFDLMSSESGFGMGQNVMRALGSANRSGAANPDNLTPSVIGNVVALGMASGISKARLPELFDQLSQALDDNTEAVGDISSISNRNLFISQLGQQFRGNTPAHRAMEQSITGLAQGNNAYTQMTRLQAAGFGQPGVSYASALERAQMGVDKQGGVGYEQLIQANFGPYVAAYKQGSADQRTSIVMVVSQLTGLPMPRVRKIMERLAQKPIDKLNADVGYSRFGALSQVPRNIIKQRVQRAVGEDMLRFGIGSTTDTGDAIGIGGSSAGASPLMPQAGAASSGADSGSLFGVGEGAYKAKRANAPQGHPGIDSNPDKVPAGSMIYSPCDGMIMWVQPNGKGDELGFDLVIKDDKTGAFVRIFHLDPSTVDRNRIRVGKRVYKGQPLGKTMSRVGSSPSHVHVGLSNKLYTGDQGYATMDPSSLDLTSMINPSVKTAGGASIPAASIDSGGGATVANNTAASAAGAVTTHVNITVTDKTEGGIDVAQETSTHAKKAKAPAPGDAPAMRNE